MANSTKIMHKSIQEGKIVSHHQDKEIIENEGNVFNNVLVDIEEFKNLYTWILQCITIRYPLEIKYNIPIINYETLIQDLWLNNIPVGSSNLIKIYTEPYSKFVTNYEELVQLSNKLNIEYNYEQ